MNRLGWTRIITPAAYILLLGVIAVFAHSGLQSDHGLAAFREAGSAERRLAGELETLRAERERLASRVLRLSDRDLDLDLLDERARLLLGLVRPDEIVVR